MAKTYKSTETPVTLAQLRTMTDMSDGDVILMNADSQITFLKYGLALETTEDVADHPYVVEPTAGTGRWVEQVTISSLTSVFTIDGDGEIIADLPTSDPSVAGALYANSAVVTVSAG